jgi:DNA-binding winged helix-turn-helix (wHTH) protein
VTAPRFRFQEFLLSPAHRTLRRGDRDLPLIRRYFDLLVLLVVERHRVVTRQEIFDRVWSDVVVSDGALSQAIRTIRRVLGDDSREPRCVRTVSRHGYQFVATEVIEESDDGPLPPPLAGVPVLAAEPPEPSAADTNGGAVPSDRFEELLARLLRRPPYGDASDEERREAAEQLHAMGTARALEQLDGVPGHAEARAVLRDARWDVPAAGRVDLLASPAPMQTIAHLVRLRLGRAWRHASNRWGAAAIGGTIAGVVAGLAGGAALWLVPGSNAHADVVLALALVGAAAGALGAAGIGAGLAVAEALARSARRSALVGCGAAGGLVAGAIAQVLTRAIVSGVFGRDLPSIGGWVEGIFLGAAAGLGYGLSTSLQPGGGFAAPRGAARVRAAFVTGIVAAVAAVALTLAGRHFIAASLDVMAGGFEGSRVGLAPLARLFGEESLRPVTRTVVSAFEGLMFGIGLAGGLTHRPAHR